VDQDALEHLKESVVDTLFEMFERIEAFFGRLDTYTGVGPNQGMVDMITAIMVEVLNILTIATKEIKQGQKSKSVIDGAQYTFNQSSKIVQLLMCVDGKETGGVIQQTADDVVQVKRSWSPNRIHAGHAGSIILTGSQLRQDLRRWLSPPGPSTNHNIACNAHHTGTSTWFFDRRTYKEWKITGSESLLWIHGKRTPVPFRHPTPRSLFVAGSGKSILWFVEQ
jgi:hypothetical protein